MTIFGFNTDLRHGDTVYHVQTEARENEATMQSAIFVRGRCIGKHIVSYAAESENADFGESYVHQLVTQQHRFVLNTIREGKLDSLLAPRLAVPSSSAQHDPEEIAVECLADAVIWESDRARIRFRVMLSTGPLPDARIMTRLECAGCGPVYAEASTDDNGEAELVYGMQSGNSSGSCLVLAKVTAGSRSVTRKFRLQRK